MRPQALITTTVQRRGEIVVVTVNGGEIDMASAPTLRWAIHEVMSQGVTALVIDLSKVAFLASVGLMVLLSTQERLADARRFAVVADGAVARPIHLTRLDEVISLRPTLDEAISCLQDRGFSS